MITRTHSEAGRRSEAVFSKCEQYRYALTRTWDTASPRLLFVMLNPSKADEFRNDPTVERCERRARALGYGAFRVVNIFAIRQTDPNAMRKAVDPLGTYADVALTEGVLWADDVLAAWGVHGEHMDRGPQVANLLSRTGRPMFHLGLTKAGHPRHPLYVSYATKPTRWLQLDSFG